MSGRSCSSTVAGEAYEVEFVTAGGETVAVLTLRRGEVRAFDDGENLHARQTDAP